MNKRLIAKRLNVKKVNYIFLGRRQKLCERCKKESFPIGRQKYCGSLNKKLGCSYEVRKERQRGYNRTYAKRHPDVLLEHWKKKEQFRKMTGFYKSKEVKQRMHENYLKRKLRKSY
jgi:hypothetical protein